MSLESRIFVCQKCGQGFFQPGVAVGACLKCKTGKLYPVEGPLTIESIHIKLKRPGIEKALFEDFRGKQHSAKLGRSVNKRRLIDRNNGMYLEVVVDPDTGEIIHYCVEPLAKHRGHGSAKSKAKSARKR